MEDASISGPPPAHLLLSFVIFHCHFRFHLVFRHTISKNHYQFELEIVVALEINGIFLGAQGQVTNAASMMTCLSRSRSTGTNSPNMPNTERQLSISVTRAYGPTTQQIPIPNISDIRTFLTILILTHSGLGGIGSVFQLDTPSQIPRSMVSRRKCKRL